jgi:hypothetical protein
MVETRYWVREGNGARTTGCRRVMGGAFPRIVVHLAPEKFLTPYVTLVEGEVGVHVFEDR